LRGALFQKAFGPFCLGGTGLCPAGVEAVDFSFSPNSLFPPSSLWLIPSKNLTNPGQIKKCSFLSSWIPPPRRRAPSLRLGMPHGPVVMAPSWWKAFIAPGIFVKGPDLPPFLEMPQLLPIPSMPWAIFVGRRNVEVHQTSVPAGSVPPPVQVVCAIFVENPLKCSLGFSFLASAGYFS